MTDRYLKGLLLFSVIYEIFFGIILIFFIEPLFKFFGILILPINYPIFSQVAGLLAICIGIILCYSVKDPEKFLINLLVSIGLRIALQVIIIVNIIMLPFMDTMLLMFGLIDLVLAILTLISIKVAGISIRDNL